MNSGPGFSAVENHAVHVVERSGPLDGDWMTHILCTKTD